MTSSRYRAILFDLDGTLVDSYAALTEAINHTRRAYRLTDLSREQVQCFVGEGAERLLHRVFAPSTVPEEASALFEAKYDEICCDLSALLDEVEPTLAEIAAENIAMAVCTNKPTHFSRKILRHLGVERFFAAVVGPDVAGARKPDSRHVLYTLAETGAAPAEALFVGDMPIDVAAARASGLDVAVIATGSASAESLRRAGPDFFLKRFPDVLDLVKTGVLSAR